MKSSLPGVSFLFASQSRPNVSPGNGHEFYSGLIFLVPIVWRGTRARVSPLFCYQSSLDCRCCSPPRGCIPNFSATPVRPERGGRGGESSTAVVASLANFARLHFQPLPLPRLASGRLRRKHEFRKRPRGREIREGYGVWMRRILR